MSNSCPICFEEIASDFNCMYTECRHKFHTKCFLQHTQANGYSCPYCRDVILQPIEVYDSDADSDISSSDEDNIQESFIGNSHVFIPDDEYSLHPFRWMMQKYNYSTSEEKYGDAIIQEELLRAYKFNDREQIDEILMKEEHKKIIENFEKMIKKQVSYQELLAAYLFHVCFNYRYSMYSQECNSKLSKTVNVIHTKKMCPTSQTI